MLTVRGCGWGCLVSRVLPQGPRGPGGREHSWRGFWGRAGQGPHRTSLGVRWGPHHPCGLRLRLCPASLQTRGSAPGPLCVGGAHCGPLEGRKEGSGNLAPGLSPRAQPSPASPKAWLSVCAPKPEPSWAPSELATPLQLSCVTRILQPLGAAHGPHPTTWEQLSAWAREGILFKLRGYPLQPPPRPTLEGVLHVAGPWLICSLLARSRHSINAPEE